MSPSKENERHLRTLTNWIDNANKRVARLYHIEDTTRDLAPSEKRERTFAIKRMMQDSRELWLRNSGLWRKGIRK